MTPAAWRHASGAWLQLGESGEVWGQSADNVDPPVRGRMPVLRMIRGWPPEVAQAARRWLRVRGVSTRISGRGGRSGYVTLGVPPEVREMARRLAASSGLPLSAVVEAALDTYARSGGSDECA